MNIMMLALLQGRLWEVGLRLQRHVDHWRPIDDAIPASDTSVQQLRAIMLERTQAELAKVTRALELLDEGRYGFCDACSKPMEPDRLLVRPHSLLCMHCHDRAPSTPFNEVALPPVEAHPMSVH
jgi:RNA polymerase-binding transcription factor DksA